MPDMEPHMGKTVALNIPALVADLDALAEQTWQKVHDGPAYGVRFREESLTEHNLFALKVAHPQLRLRKFTTSEERRNGADWEWWVGTDRDGWIGLRIQAKKMSAGAYRELPYRAKVEARTQCDVLIETVDQDSQNGVKALFPYYCMYNGWDAATGWPSDAPWTVRCSRPAPCRNVPRLQVFGCALQPAEYVRRVLGRQTSAVSASEHLPYQRPWSWLFRNARTKNLRTREILKGLLSVHEELASGYLGPPQDELEHRNQRIPELFRELPEYAQMIRLGVDQRELDLPAPVSYALVADLLQA